MVFLLLQQAKTSILKWDSSREKITSASTIDYNANSHRKIPIFFVMDFLLAATHIGKKTTVC